MNVTNHKHFNSATLSNEIGGDKMDQIRELLFGDFERMSRVKLAELEARVQELELSVHQRLDTLQDRLETLAIDVAKDQHSAFDDLARGINELGERIGRPRSK